MNRQRTFKEYMIIDITLWAIIMAVFEFLIVMARNWWFPTEIYTVSLEAAITAIVFMRWGFWGAIHAVVGGFVFCTFSSANVGQYIIYCVGDLLAVAAVLPLRKLGKEKVRQNVWLTLGFAFLVQLLMQLGRALVAMALGSDLAAAAGFFTADSLSYVFTLVIIWIARKLDGVYEDQKHYLLRLNAPEE